MGQGRRDIGFTVWRNKVVCLPSRGHRTDSRWIKVLNLKSETIKLREDIMGDSFWSRHRKVFYNQDRKGTHTHTF